LVSEAKAKDYSFKAKDTISWPRGQGHGLEDSISAPQSSTFELCMVFIVWITLITITVNKRNLSS